jgi:processive 1,2-diacylglycerol beta-glucosyltransferase
MTRCPPASSALATEAGLRVLLMCADIGEGHLTAARALCAELREHPQVGEVCLLESLDVLGRRLGPFLTDSFRVHLDRIGWSYDLAYRVFFERAAPRAAAHLALAALGQRGLRRALAAHRPDVVVTEYPVLSAALGELRGRGRLAVPVCSGITDPAGLFYWAHPGIDLHLLSWPESRAEVDRIAGPGRAAAVRPAVERRFFELPSRAQARRRLSLEAERIVVVSGGGWGMGDLAGAVASVRRELPAAQVVALAGRSRRALHTLQGAFAGDPLVRVLGFTGEMALLLRAADVLIHTTGGTTALEARLAGCALVNFGSGPAHVRAHARAMERWGLAERAPDLASLGAALGRALGRASKPDLEVARLPSAADAVVGVAQRARARSAAPAEAQAGARANQRTAAQRASAAGRGR